MKNNEYLSTEELLAEVLKELKEIKSKLHGNNKPIEFGWIDNADLIRLLNITARSAASYRKNHILPFSKLNGKIYYRLTDIEQVLLLNRKI